MENSHIKINHNEKIFIAGGSGMVGSAVNRALQKKGYGCTSNSEIIYAPSRKELDLTDHKAVNDWFEKFKPTVVIIAAAKVGGILANNKYPYDFLLDNLKIQTNLIEISWLKGVKRLLFLGSSCIYPKFAKQPIKEEYLLTDYLEKTNECYAIAKISGLKLCEALNIQHGFDAISLMPTNLYGIGDNYNLNNSHVMPALIRKYAEAKKNNLDYVTCWGSGEPMREFLFVDDLADACIFALENWDPKEPSSPKKSNGENLYWLNVGSNYEISIKDLAKKISKIIGFTGQTNWDRDKPDGTPRKKLDITNLSNIGWNAKTNLDDGINLTYKNFCKIYKSNLLRD